MKFVNKSVKVIGIKGQYVLPDESIELTAEEQNLPAIKAFVRLGLGVLEPGQAEFDAAVAAAVKAKAAEAEAVPEEEDKPAEAVEAEEKPKPAKRTRRKAE